MRRLTLLALLIALVPMAGHAAPQDGGCTAVEIGAGGNCRYVSHGPGAFVATTVSGFRIQACPGDQYNTTSGVCAVAWRFIAGAAPAPTSGIAVIGGPLDTTDGEVVDVSVSVVDLRNPYNNTHVLYYEDGAVTAHDLPPM